MKFTVEHVVNVKLPNCKMRIGKISDVARLPNATFLTPLILLYTKGASVTHLTREVLDMTTNISEHGLQIPLANSVRCCEGAKHFKEGVASFAGLKESFSYCSIQDPAEDTRVGFNERKSITIWTNIGRKQLTPDSYMDMIEALRPDMYHALCDGDTSSQSSRKRVNKAVDVSANMFLTCADRHAKSKRLKDSALFAVVEGGYDLQARRDAAEMFNKHPLVQGFVIDGLHNNGPAVEQIEFDTIKSVVSETLNYLPEDKLRIAHGSWRPDVVLELVKAGVDVFDSSLPYLVTQRGCALTFTYKVIQNDDGTSVVNNISNGYHEDSCEDLSPPNASEKVFKKSTNYEMNLKDQIYFEDLTPIMSNCECLACSKKYTRAYIHHLLNSKEMLASVLLMIHNLHHYEQFFHTIRETGKKSQLLTIDPPLS